MNLNLRVHGLQDCCCANLPHNLKYRTVADGQKRVKIHSIFFNKGQSYLSLMFHYWKSLHTLC